MTCNSPLLRQTWTVSGVLINIIGLGCMLGYPDSILPALKSKNSEIVADTSDASWIASCIGLSGIPGLLVSSYFMDKYGRRLSHAILILPGAIGWIIIYFSQNVTSIIIGRCFNGFTSGATVTLGAIVIGEYSSPRHRGIFLNLKTAAACTGVIATHILGNFCQWRTVALIGALPQIVAILITFTWPESPSWLIMKNRFEDSDRAFYWLRGESPESTKELTNMQRAQMERQTGVKERSLSTAVLLFFKKFQQKDFVKPVIILTVSFTLLEACGRHTFPAYAKQMIGGFNDDKSQIFYYTLGVDAITTTTTLVSSFIVKIFRRRTLLFASGVSSVIVLLIICLYLFLISRGVVSRDKQWIPLMLFGLYFVLSNVGCTFIPLALLGEIFPLAHRSVGTAVSGIIMSVILNAVLKATPYMLEYLNVYGTFTIFAAFMVGSLLCLYFMLPETKNRTLQEIEEFFLYGEFQDSNVIYYAPVSGTQSDLKTSLYADERKEEKPCLT